MSETPDRWASSRDDAGPFRANLANWRTEQFVNYDDSNRKRYTVLCRKYQGHQITEGTVVVIDERESGKNPSVVPDPECILFERQVPTHDAVDKLVEAIIDHVETRGEFDPETFQATF